MEFSFTTTLQRFNNNLWDIHFIVDEAASEYFIKEKNTRRVVCTVNDSVTFHCALMHDGNGQFFININKENRKKQNLTENDQINVKLVEDTSKYGIPLPDEMKELLALDEEGSDLFHQLTIGKQRTLLHIVGKPKTSDTRLKKALVILDYLKDNKGVLDFKQLNQAFKDANNKFN